MIEKSIEKISQLFSHFIVMPKKINVRGKVAACQCQCGSFAGDFCKGCPEPLDSGQYNGYDRRCKSRRYHEAVFMIHGQ
jgi:hypothetical protein